MLIGYARVSTNDQETATQVAALKAAGCERDFIARRPPGDEWDRPELQRLLDTGHARETCSLCGSSIGSSRLTARCPDDYGALGRSRSRLYRSLTEAIDTTTPPGRMMMGRW